ncbi:MAG: hypothetical protein Q7S40_03515 [Opitutaceae bacterium]|nr:hypothetical protein [Opitutaceae bacterium]
MKLQNISDINVSTRVDGSFLAWDNASQRWLCAPPLTGFSQVDVASRVSGSVLEWNPAASKWVASPHRADGQLYQSFTQSGTVGAQSDLMYTSIPANTMSANGDRLRAAGVFSTVASGEKCIKAYFGSTLIADVSHYNFNTPSRPVHVFGEVIITRTAAATQNVFSRFWDETHWLSAGTIEFSPPPVYNVSAFTGVSLTLSSANTFKFNASGAGTDDIVQKEMLIEYLPAP